MVDEVEARVSNPLSGVSRSTLFASAEEFARECGLIEHIGLFQRGALVAQSPAAFEQVDSLTGLELAALRDEVLHKWRQPRALYLTALLCSVGAAAQGWEQAGSIAANFSWPTALGVQDDGPHAAVWNSWIVGLVTAAPYLGSAFLGCWVTDPLNSLYGRRGTMLIAAIFCMFSIIGSTMSKSWPELLILRLLLGISTGVEASTIPIYAAECFPTAIRGGLMVSWQMGSGLGLCLGFCASLVLQHVESASWRLQLGSAIIPLAPLILLVFACSESPQWYIKKGRFKDAFASLCALRNSKLQASRDLYYSHARMLEEAHIVGRSNYFRRCCELFTVPRIRRATLASSTVMIAKQACGMGAAIIFSSTIFTDAGAGPTTALLAPCGLGLVMFASAWLAVLSIDTHGRRTLLLFTLPQMIWILLAAGLCFLIPPSSTAHRGLIASFLFLSAAFYSAGVGAVSYAYTAEVFPLSHREAGMAWAVATNFFTGAVLSTTFPSTLQAFGASGLLGFHAGLNLVAVCAVFVLVPESKLLTLEELDHVFATPSRLFARHQLTTVLPWWIRRHVFRRKSVMLNAVHGVRAGAGAVTTAGAGAGAGAGPEPGPGAGAGVMRRAPTLQEPHLVEESMASKE